jgi:hypothetical protein
MDSRFNDICDALHMISHFRLRFNRTNNRPLAVGGDQEAEKSKSPILFEFGAVNPQDEDG